MCILKFSCERLILLICIFLHVSCTTPARVGEHFYSNDLSGSICFACGTVIRSANEHTFVLIGAIIIICFVIILYFILFFISINAELSFDSCVSDSAPFHLLLFHNCVLILPNDLE